MKANKILFQFDRHPETREEMYGPPPQGVTCRQWKRQVLKRISEIVKWNARFRHATGFVKAMRRAKDELRRDHARRALEVALAAGRKAGDRHMKATGRTTWNRADLRLAVEEVNRILGPTELDRSSLAG